MTPEQIADDARRLSGLRDEYDHVLTQAADLALTRRMFGVEEWFRYCSGLHVNLAGPVPAEYMIAVEAAHLIMAGHEA